MPSPSTLKTTLKPHQRRVVERIAGQPGLVVAHGLGSGKTLSSIAAAESLGGATSVLVPAALQANYQKELAKHLAANPRATFNVGSLQSAALSGEIPKSDLLVVDEAHRLRDPGSSSNEAVRNAQTLKRLLLTGTPLYNSPADLGALVNLASGEKLLPEDKQSFESEFVNRTEVDPGFIAKWIRGISPGERVNLTNTSKLKGALDKWVDYQENDTEGFPQRVDETIDTVMSPEQRALYQQAMGAAPSWVDYKMRHSLPPSKQESKDLNAFLGAVRQISVSPGGFNTKLTPLQAAQQSPKIQEAFKRFQAGLESNPAHKALVYSNYLDSGIAPYEALLQDKKIPYGKFTGEISKQERDKMVQDYNAGALKALLVSSAGGEGLDLKGTRQVQILEPHWNREKLEQVIGRGIRYQSHAGLPADQQKVNVERYRSVNEEPNALWKWLGYDREGAVDEYLEGISQEKDKLNEQVREILRGRKPKGYTEKASMLQSEAYARGYLEMLEKFAGQPSPYRAPSPTGQHMVGSANPLNRVQDPNAASMEQATQDFMANPAHGPGGPSATSTEQATQDFMANPAHGPGGQDASMAQATQDFMANPAHGPGGAQSPTQASPPDYASQIFSTQRKLSGGGGSHADRLALSATLNNLKTQFMAQPGANAGKYNRALNTGRA